MAQIFIAYAREDEVRIQPIVEALHDRGWSVFWDRRIPAGQTWRSHIGEALKEANCVIVVWSHDSVVSSWVSEEADEGQRRKILVPVLLDTVEPPMGFRSIQAADLTGWPSEESSPRFEQLLSDIGALLETPPSSTSATAPLQASTPITDDSEPFTNKRGKLLAMVALVLVATLGIVYWSGIFAKKPEGAVTSETARVADGSNADSKDKLDIAPNDAGAKDPTGLAGEWDVKCRGALPESVTRELDKRGNANSATRPRETPNEMEDAIGGIRDALGGMAKASSAPGSFLLRLNSDRRYQISEKTGLFNEAVYEKLRPSGTWSYNPDDRRFVLIPIGESTAYDFAVETIEKNRLQMKGFLGRSCNLVRRR